MSHLASVEVKLQQRDWISVSVGLNQQDKIDTDDRDENVVSDIPAGL